MRKLGALPFSIPKEDLGFKFTKSSRRETIYRQYKIGDILNQGTTSECVGYCLYYLLDAEPFKQQPFTPHKIYTEARKIDKVSDNIDGVSLKSGVEFLKQQNKIKGQYWTDNANEVGEYINTIAPVVMSLYWSSKMDTPDKTGRLSIGGSAMGYHAVMCYGYDALKEIFYFTNSWGAEWGHNGKFNITLGDLTKLFKKGSLACSIVE